MPHAANSTLLDRFYRALQQRDGTTMAACYHADATFRDPVFELRGTRIGAMWKMLTQRGADLRVEFGNVVTDADAGSADCEAWYTFSATGRRVHNVIHSDFRFADGLILAQVDAFDFWRWSRQALGPAGLLLGWSPLLRRKVQAQATKALERYLSS
jgi:hypothetical protein